MHEIDYGYIAAGHVLPRTHGIFLNGTFDRDDWSLGIIKEQSNRILNTRTEIKKGLRAPCKSLFIASIPLPTISEM